MGFNLSQWLGVSHDNSRMLDGSCVWVGCAHRSNQQWTFGVHGRVCSVVLHPSLPFLAQEVESQTVAFQICELEEFSTERHPTIIFQHALEDGVLHTLAVVKAGFGDTAQAALAIASDGRDIVADENHHGRKRGSKSSPLERRVGIEVAAEVACKKQGLGV